MTRKFNCFNQVARALIEAETRIGHHLSSSQRQFVILLSKKNELVNKKRKRTSEEEALLKTLQNKIKNSKRNMKDYDERLKLPIKTDAERKSERRKKRTEEQIEKDKSTQRMCMVAQRAGGLTEARKTDVRLGRKKNKCTGIYSGDALRSKEIEEGCFLVESLTGGSDGLGSLGDVSCNHCGGLRYILSSDQLTDLFAFCKMICPQVEA